MEDFYKYTNACDLLIALGYEWDPYERDEDTVFECCEIEGYEWDGCQWLPVDSSKIVNICGHGGIVWV